MSSTSRASFSNAWICASIPERLRVTTCAFFWSSQNPGSSVCASSLPTSAFSFGRSKVPP